MLVVPRVTLEEARGPPCKENHELWCSTEIALVGGGIGGLAAALALLTAGFDGHVDEQTAAFAEIGAGIQISPDASRILERLGLAPELRRVGVQSVAIHQRRWDDGRTLLRTP